MRLGLLSSIFALAIIFTTFGIAAFHPVFAATSTVTYTSTSTTITGATTTVTTTEYNSSSGVSSTTGFFFLLVLIVGPALMIGGISASAAGGIFGAAMGAAIGAIPAPDGPGLIPFYVIPVMVLLMVLSIFFLRSGGGKGL